MKHIHRSHQLQDVLGEDEDDHDGRCACVSHVTGCMLNNYLALQELKRRKAYELATARTLDYQAMQDHLVRDDVLFSHHLGIGHC
jgi:hypothetical protein